MGGTALGASGRSNNGLKLDVKTGKLSLWRLFPTFTFTFIWPSSVAMLGGAAMVITGCAWLAHSAVLDMITGAGDSCPLGPLPYVFHPASPLVLPAAAGCRSWCPPLGE